jgi:hypothetical protein
VHGNDVTDAAELEDTGTIPIKNTEVNMQDAANLSTGAKRGLEFSNQTKKGPLQDDIEGQTGDLNAMILDKTLPAEPVPVGGTGKDRKKRSKKDGASSNNSLGSADSSKGSVRSQ